MNTLQIIWFMLIVILMIGYAVLAGFDLGIGCWHLRATVPQRRKLIAALGPFWDGNQVWLVTLGGALFAAFPPVYATLFSGLYPAFMALLLLLILRTVAIEFSARAFSEAQRRHWDITFSISSIGLMILFGAALGIIMYGIPLDANGDYLGSFWQLLSPFALAVGVLNLLMLGMHGALYLTVKTTGELAERARYWAQISGVTFLILLLLVIIYASLVLPLSGNFSLHVALWLLPIGALISLLFTLYLNTKMHALPAFISSSLTIILLLATVGAAIFPMLVPAEFSSTSGLSIHNSSSSFLTLKTMLIIVAIGMPLVLGYTIWVHRIFRGTVDEVNYH